MICSALNWHNFRCVIPFYAQSFDDRGLEHGARVINEPYTRPGCSLVSQELTELHEAKDASILHMLQGGNGFPFAMQGRSICMDQGLSHEKADLRSYLAWSRDLGLCMNDRKRGATA
jgi:hypothetical protein